MKKLTGILILTLLFSGYSFADEAPVFDIAQASSPSGTATINPTANQPNATTATSAPTSDEKKTAETVTLDKGLEIVPTKKHEEDLTLPYIINVSYPQISGENLSAHAKAFNQLVSDTVTKSVQQFKNYVKADMPHMQTLPESMKHNTLSIDYDVSALKPANQIILSVRLSIEGMQAGRAHPYHQHQVINFDLSKGKTLALRDIFKPGANYLSVFAKYASQKLNAQLKDTWMIKEGTAPIAKNYQLWNLQGDSILITFDEYQVAPYVYGPQEVEIPYSQLKNIIAPKSPIAVCAEGKESCVME